MKKTITGLVALSVATAHAQQPSTTKWYVIVSQEAKCLPAADIARRLHTSAGVSPYAWAAYLRKEGIFKSQNIERDDAGKVKSVAITDSDDDSTIRFYATLGACAEDLKVALENGEIANPEELK
jgi:hypothetical protein